MKLSAKLLASFALLVALTAGVGGYVIFEMGKVDESYREMSSNWMPSIRVLSEIAIVIGNIRRAELLHILTTDNSTMLQLENEIESFLEIFGTKTKEYSYIATLPGEVENFPKFIETWQEYRVFLHRELELSRNMQKSLAAELSTLLSG
jgi:methyl-accepting chemotaxis protein